MHTVKQVTLTELYALMHNEQMDISHHQVMKVVQSGLLNSLNVNEAHTCVSKIGNWNIDEEFIMENLHMHLPSPTLQESETFGDSYYVLSQKEGATPHTQLTLPITYSTYENLITDVAEFFNVELTNKSEEV